LFDGKKIFAGRRLDSAKLDNREEIKFTAERGMNLHWEELDLIKIISHGLVIVFIILLAVLAHWLAKRAFRRLADRLAKEAPDQSDHRVYTLTGVASNLSGYLIFFIAALLVLGRIGVNLAPLIAGAGIAGLAIGFGAQSLVRDVVSGFFILMDGLFGVGDMVEINGIAGVVEAIFLRTTRLRDIQGEIHFIPNGTITTINRFSPRGDIFTLQIPAGQETQKTLADQLLGDFQEEYQALLDTPVWLGSKTLSDGGLLLQYRIKLFALRQDIVLQKLPAYLTGGFTRGGQPLPAGREISLLPEMLQPPRR